MTRLLLLQRIVDFRFTPFVALEYTLCDFAFLSISHNDPFVVTRCPTYIDVGDK